MCLRKSQIVTASFYVKPAHIKSTKTSFSHCLVVLTFIVANKTFIDCRGSNITSYIQTHVGLEDKIKT